MNFEERLTFVSLHSSCLTPSTHKLLCSRTFEHWTSNLFIQNWRLNVGCSMFIFPNRSVLSIYASHGEATTSLRSAVGRASLNKAERACHLILCRITLFRDTAFSLHEKNRVPHGAQSTPGVVQKFLLCPPRYYGRGFCQKFLAYSKCYIVAGGLLTL